MPRLGSVCRRLWDHDGSGWQAACHQQCSTIGEAAFRPVSLVSGTRGACDPACARFGSSGHCPTARAVSVDGLARAATQCGGLEYRATTAQWHSERAARRPKPAKLALNAVLRAYVGIKGLPDMRQNAAVIASEPQWSSYVGLIA